MGTKNPKITTAWTLREGLQGIWGLKLGGCAGFRLGFCRASACGIRGARGFVNG